MNADPYVFLPERALGDDAEALLSFLRYSVKSLPVAAAAGVRIGIICTAQQRMPEYSCFERANGRHTFNDANDARFEL